MLRAIEHRQMQFIRVFTMVFLAGLYFGSLGSRPRYVATVAVPASSAAVPMTREEPGAAQICHRGPSVAEVVATMLNSPEFARRVSRLLRKDVPASAYHARPHRVAGLVEITSEASSPSIAAETVEGVMGELTSLEDEARYNAHQEGLSFFRRMTRRSRERVRRIPAGDPRATVARRERDDFAKALKLLEARTPPRSYCASHPLANVEACPPAPRTALLPGLLGMTLAVLAVLVGDLNPRRRR